MKMHIINIKKDKGKYTASFALFDIGKTNIFLVEEYKCYDKKQLEGRDREIIRQTVCINKTFNEEEKE